MSEQNPSDQPKLEADESASPVEEDKKWWDDPSMPWGHKPTKADAWCWALLTISGIYGIAMIPLRAWLITHPYHYAFISGGNIGMVAVGALTATDPAPNHLWLWCLLAASVSVVKFNWLLWWAGHLWGHHIIETWKGTSPRVRSWMDKIQTWTVKHPILAIGVSWVPIPIPLAPVISATLGASGVSLTRFMVIDWVYSLLTRAGVMYLGFRIGEPAVHLLDQYSKYALYIALGLTVIVIWRTVAKASKDAKAEAVKDAPKGTLEP